MPANPMINVRCPQYVIDLIDKVCDMYGFTRAELMRTGAINYCQSLLVTDSLKNLCNVVERLNKTKSDFLTDDEKAEFKFLIEQAEMLSKSLGLE